MNTSPPHALYDLKDEKGGSSNSKKGFENDEERDRRWLKWKEVQQGCW